MKKRFFILLIFTLCMLSACANYPTLVPDATPNPSTADDATTTSSTDLPATPDPITAESVGRSFLEAMRQSDLEAMYALFSANAKTAYPFETFANRFSGSMNTTTTISMTLTPETLTIDGNSASIEFNQILHTGVFGDLHANNKFALSQNETGWWIDWTPSVIWPDLNDDVRFDAQYQVPFRENIYDRNGQSLAHLDTYIKIGIIPQNIEAESETTMVANLAQILDMTFEEVQAKYIGQPANWYLEVGEISAAMSEQYSDMLNFPGIQLRERTSRAYPEGGTGSHVTGWISAIPAERFDDYHLAGYRGDQYVGITGLEAWGEDYLSGQNGIRLQLMSISEGTALGIISEIKAEPGRALNTTIDRDLQQSAENALGQRRGAVVAIDIHTGGVLALTSGPTFDNNAFVQPYADQERANILNNPNLPLYNRAVQGLYPPGSVFKIVTLTAALEASDFSAGSTFNCPGYWDGLGVGNRKFCWKDDGHGILTLSQGLTASCNVVFYEVGSALDAIGEEILPSFGQAYGLGQLTGLPELNEAAGLMPTPAWKMETYGQSWSTGDTVNMAIGQGFLLVTPLQIARMISAVANGGTLYQPYIVSSIAENSTTAAQYFNPVTQGLVPVSSANLTTIQQAMLGVTTNTEIGTATHRFTGLDISVAGKTGTAETGHEGDIPHSWFAGYFPADNPEIAMVVMVENAGEGSSVAAPMFRQIVEGYYGYDITPLPDVVYTP